MFLSFIQEGREGVIQNAFMIQSALSDVLLHEPRNRKEHVPCLSGFLQLQFLPETPRTPRLVLGKSKTLDFWIKTFLDQDSLMRPELILREKMTPRPTSCQVFAKPHLCLLAGQGSWEPALPTFFFLLLLV